NTEADILLSDGFTANMILKTYKGTADVFLALWQCVQFQGRKADYLNYLHYTIAYNTEQTRTRVNMHKIK
ncbi:MAG: hypothetical protein Q8877_03110, partial [Sweet potato little leaf phytoplasma]|nr:hypothetical protein [Sweet potato little leaf phytoplasma]